MKSFDRLHNYKHWGLLALRLSTGLIFIIHGYMKWAIWSATTVPAQMTPQMVNLSKFLSIVEPLGGLALVLGFLTELAGLGLGIIMIGAIYFKIQVWHVPFTAQNTTGWEFDLILLGASIALFFVGAGKISLDRAWLKKS